MNTMRTAVLTSLKQLNEAKYQWPRAALAGRVHHSASFPILASHQEHQRLEQHPFMSPRQARRRHSAYPNHSVSTASVMTSTAVEQQIIAANFSTAFAAANGKQKTER